jgi:hypothetical protein
MNRNVNSLLALLSLVIVLGTGAAGQKVKVGYDKSVDFSTYTSYTLMDPSTPPTRPLLYASVIGWADKILTSKGLIVIEKDGDLLLVPSGGTEFGLNTKAGTPIMPSYSGAPVSMDASMWTGAGGSSNSLAPYVPEGTLMLTFIDRKANKVVWSGTVTQKLDIERKQKSLELAEKAVAKLLDRFPPQHKK